MPEVGPPRQSWSALAAHALLLGGAGAAISLAGSAEQGNLGVFLLCAGVALVACPPRVRVEWPLWAAAGGLAGGAALAFLPARWVPAPTWRRALESASAIVLPGSITPWPAATEFWLALLALSLATGLFALSQPVRARWSLWFALAAVLACATYATLAMAARVLGWQHPVVDKMIFGFLPNRNHTATLLITGGVLAAGVMGVAFRDRRRIVANLAMAGAAPCLAGLFFFSTSRAGVLILLAGVGAWVAGLGGRHRPGRLLAAAGVAAAAAVAVFLAFKSPARDRLLDTVGVRAGEHATATPKPTPLPSPGLEAKRRAPGEAPPEFRLAVYRDALGLIGEQPWTGSGLGTFAGVFGPYRQASLSESNALHPESDWLMLAAEAGWPACGFAALLVGLAARRLAGQREHPYWPLRWGFAAAAGAAVLHSVVDVPVHRAAVGWWVLALAGLALQRQPVSGGERNFDAKARRSEDPRREEEGRGGDRTRRAWVDRVQHAVFVLAGIGALGLGGVLVRAEWFGGKALAPFAADAAPRAMFDLYQQKRYAQGLALGRETLRESPLTASAYYYMGILIAATSDEEDADQRVDEMFQAERVLDPVMPDPAYHQAAAWAGYDPVRQTTMTLEALGRQARINRGMGRVRLNLPLYRDLVSNAAAQPDVQRDLLAAARPDGRFEEMWKLRADQGLLQTRVDRIAEDAAWAAAGGVVREDWYEQPESAGPSRPAAGEAWDEAAWPVRVRQCVYAGKYEEAVGMMTRRYGISLAGGDGGDAGAEEAARAAREGKWKEAWLALEKYVRHTRQMEWP